MLFLDFTFGLFQKLEFIFSNRLQLLL